MYNSNFSFFSNTYRNTERAKKRTAVNNCQAFYYALCQTKNQTFSCYFFQSCENSSIIGYTHAKMNKIMVKVETILFFLCSNVAWDPPPWFGYQKQMKSECGGVTHALDSNEMRRQRNVAVGLGWLTGSGAATGNVLFGQEGEVNQERKEPTPRNVASKAPKEIK